MTKYELVVCDHDNCHEKEESHWCDEYSMSPVGYSPFPDGTGLFKLLIKKSDKFQWLITDDEEVWRHTRIDMLHKHPPSEIMANKALDVLSKRE